MGDKCVGMCHVKYVKSPYKHVSIRINIIHSVYAPYRAYLKLAKVHLNQASVVHTFPDSDPNKPERTTCCNVHTSQLLSVSVL
jgi:hypothetical protein